MCGGLQNISGQKGFNFDFTNYGQTNGNQHASYLEEQYFEEERIQMDPKESALIAEGKTKIL